jgi:cysteine desulfurase
MKTPVYLDHHSTTPCDPRVVDAMAPYFTDAFANASSPHAMGRRAAEAVERARAQVAALIGAAPGEILFTGGATESIELALDGAAEGSEGGRNHLVTAATEHKAVLLTLERLARRGYDLTVLPVDSTGQIDPDRLLAAVTDRTLLVALMLGNNEIGTLHPLAGLGARLRERGVLFFCDAVQAAGRIPLNVTALGIDLLPLSAHKLYGPKGVGALFVRRSRPRIRLAPRFLGGGQERGLRAGTLNVPGIVGFGVACEIASADLGAEGRRIGGLRNRLERALLASVPGARVNGHPAERLPGNLSVSFDGVAADRLVERLASDICVSTGATCTATSVEPSHVLTAIGLDAERARGTLRFGLGRFTTDEEVDFAALRVAEAVGKKSLEAAPAP